MDVSGSTKSGSAQFVADFCCKAFADIEMNRRAKAGAVRHKVWAIAQTLTQRLITGAFCCVIYNHLHAIVLKIVDIQPLQILSLRYFNYSSPEITSVKNKKALYLRF